MFHERFVIVIYWITKKFATSRHLLEDGKFRFKLQIKNSLYIVEEFRCNSSPKLILRIEIEPPISPKTA